MGKPPIRAATRAVLGLAALGVCAAALAGCLDTGFPAPSTTPQPTRTTAGPTAPVDTPAATPTPTESPSPSATPTDPPTPVAADCDELIPLQALYDISPNYAVGDPVKAAKAGTLAAQALGFQGTACSVIRTSGSGSSAIITISEPGRSTLVGLKASAGARYNPCKGASCPPPLYGADGRLTAFVGSDWFTAEGTSQFDPDDLAAILAAVAAAAKG